jgi:hypothetical protein
MAARFNFSDNSNQTHDKTRNAFFRNWVTRWRVDDQVEKILSIQVSTWIIPYGLPKNQKGDTILVAGHYDFSR